MDNFYLSAVVREATADIVGRRVARVSSSSATLLIDLRLDRKRRLIASLDRTAPAFYLSNRARIDKNRPARSAIPFALLLDNRLAGAKLAGISKTPLDRIVEIEFERLETGEDQTRVSLLLAFTGSSANAFLLDDERNVISSMYEGGLPGTAVLGNQDQFARLTDGLRDSMSKAEILDWAFGAGSLSGPQIKAEFLARCPGGEPAAVFRTLVSELLSARPRALVYSRFPLDELDERVINPRSDLLLSNIELEHAGGMVRREFATLSEAADAYHFSRARALALRSDCEQLRHRLSREINKCESALGRIESDARRFGDPETLKRRGDLLLANLANAEISGNLATVVDYYDPRQPKIRIDLPEGASLEQAAADYFNRYRRARRASEAIESRKRELSKKLAQLVELVQQLEREATRASIQIVRERAAELPGSTEPVHPEVRKKKRKGGADRIGRWFRSTDGYEIAVGKNDRENDALTFRVARPHDLWLHAADYPGSHVIVRNPSREDVPRRTITEAAALAAFNSQAKREGRAAVHYTQRKYVSKPPRSKPGLVRLASFKTILVHPGGDLKRIE